MRSEPARVLFVYWGRRGLSRFTLEVARAASASSNMEATISLSRQNENFLDFCGLGSALLPVNTFTSSFGAITGAWRIFLLRKQLANYVVKNRVDTVIELMPHAWSSLVFPVVKQSGARYAIIVHDAVTHPGDYRSLSISRLVDRSISQADVVLTLSEEVAARLIAAGKVQRSQVFALFHPDLSFGSKGELPLVPDEPLRVAFLGRIMPYKGLSLFLDMIDILRDEGIAVEVGVFGEGELGENAKRLAQLGADVVNRWLTDDEIGAILPRFHALVLSHIEASQSGIVATAFGAGLPVIATPVGGLVEQVQDGIGGVLARSVDAPALAEATKRLLLNPLLYRAICRNIAATKEKRSTGRFVEDCVSYVKLADAAKHMQ